MTAGEALFLALFVPGLILVVAVVAVAARRALRDERRLREGRCVHCGGDLRGAGETCPGCGETAPPLGGSSDRD